MAEWRFSPSRIRRNGRLFLGCGLLIFLILLTLGAPLITKTPPDQADLFSAEFPPGREGHFLGTDSQGFDVASRLFYGGRLTLLTAFEAISLALFLGIPLGALGGYFGGRWDWVSSALTHLLLTFPALLTAICIVSFLGKSIENLLLAVSLVEIPRIAKQTRAAFQIEKSKDYLMSARALGASRFRQIFRILLPNCLPPILVVASMGLAGSVLEVAGLSYLGLGPEPGTAEWGLMIAESQTYLESTPWAVMAPGVAISLTVFAFNLIGDGLQGLVNTKVIFD